VDDLVQFLRARLDEDEALAREAPAGPWHIGNAVDPTQPCSVHMFPSVRLVADGLNWLVAEHIARHDPARVLREIDAKRKIAEQHRPVGYGDVCLSYCHTRTPSQPQTWPCLTLRLLALPFTDRPGYREEWRP